MVGSVLVTDARTQAAVDTVIRLESARLIAGLAHYTGDIGMAEDLAQDAVVAALEQWPGEGVPRNAGAWLMTVAKRRAIDTFRRNRELAKRYAQLGPHPGGRGGDSVTPDFDRAFSDRHRRRPAATDLHRLSPGAEPARPGSRSRCGCWAGSTTTEIARAYLVPEPTIAQRIVRAKKTLAPEHVPFEVPAADHRRGAAVGGARGHLPGLQRGLLGDGGRRLDAPRPVRGGGPAGRVLAQLTPAEPEVQGLVALLEIQSSRIAARTAPDGSPVLLLDQDRARWDRLLINRGLAALCARPRTSAGERTQNTGRTCCRR